MRPPAPGVGLLPLLTMLQLNGPAFGVEADGSSRRRMLRPGARCKKATQAASDGNAFLPCRSASQVGSVICPSALLSPALALLARAGPSLPSPTFTPPRLFRARRRSRERSLAEFETRRTATR